MKSLKCLSLSVAVAYTVSLTSCDYLDVVPPKTVDYEDTMKDKNLALNFLYSCYNATLSKVSNNTCDYFQAADEFAVPIELNSYSHGVAFDTFNPVSIAYPWNTYYSSIHQTNLFLKALDELNTSGVTDEEKERWRAEGYFLLGYYHLNLLEAYGPICLVGKSYPQTTATSDFPGRSHFNCCVDTIAAWFDKAAEVLPATGPDDELGRATSTACKALKAKALLIAASPLWNGGFPFPDWKNSSFMTEGYDDEGNKAPGKATYELVSHEYHPERWERALSACKEALQLATTDGNRSLMTEEISEILRANQQVPLPQVPGKNKNKEEDAAFLKKVMLFRYLAWSAETDGNREYIYAASARKGKQTLNMEAALPHAIFTAATGSPIGGKSYVAPFLYTVEHFYTERGYLPENDITFPHKEEWLTSAGLSNPDIIKLNVGREPRFYAWLSFDGDEYAPLLAKGSPLIIKARDSKKQGYNKATYTSENSVTGYFSKKGVQPDLKWRDDGGSCTFSSASNFLNIRVSVMRLAELYLDLAECHAMLGHEQEALDNLNIIRRRAGIEDLTPTMIAGSGMSLIDWIRNERFVELWGEYSRYFDLRRWMLAPERLKKGTREGLNAMQKNDPSFEEFNKRIVIDQPYKWTNRLYLLPMNVSELYSNPQLVQSPGY